VASVKVNKPLTIDGGGQWVAGTSDDAIMIQEVDTPTDNVCLKTSGDALYVYQGDCTNRANVYASGLSAATLGLTSYLEVAATGNPTVYVLDGTSPGVDGETSGSLLFKSYDDAGTPSAYNTVSLKGYGVENANADNDGKLIISVMDNDVDTTYLTLDATDATEGVITGKPLTVDASDAADAGAIRLDNAENICWEASPAGTDTCIGVNSSEKLAITPTYEVCSDILGQSKTQGPTAPSPTLHDTMIGYGFNAVGEQLGMRWEVPDCWAGGANMTLKFYWTPQDGDASALNEEID
jgi:hypothetical protein